MKANKKGKITRQELIEKKHGKAYQTLLKNKKVKNRKSRRP